MKNTYYFFIFIFCGGLLASCLRLDSNMYNPLTDIEAYLLDDFTGETDFHLDAGYDIPDSLIHRFTLRSVLPGEDDGVLIHAVYIGDTHRIAQDTVIYYLHGNFGHMDFYWPRAKLLANTGGKNRYGVLMIDFRGFGLSEGSPTEEGLYADAEAGLLWLKNKGLTGDRLALYGFSMGSAPATKLTAEPGSLQASWLMLEAPFASADVLVADAAGLNMPGSFFTNLKIDVAEKIQSVEEPLFWIHGTDDHFLAIETNGEVVFKQYHGQRGRAVRVEGAGHSTVPQTLGFENYLTELSAFLSQP